jgi:hypothetical protein
MIKKLDVQRIKKFWEEIKPLISGGLWPVSDATDEMIYEALIDERIFCYVIVAPDKDVIGGVVIVGVTKDTLSGSKTMMILTAREFKLIEPKEWADLFVEISKDAKLRGCKYLNGFSSSKHVNELATKLGANTDFTFVNFSLGGEP